MKGKINIEACFLWRISLDKFLVAAAFVRTYADRECRIDWNWIALFRFCDQCIALFLRWQNKNQ